MAHKTQTEDTIFGKIIRGEIPTNFVYQDDKCVAFKDIHPMAPVHLLVVPRKNIPNIREAELEDQQLLGHLLLVARQLAKDNKLDDGFRLVINTDTEGNNSVPHLHIHVLGGRPLGWPAG